jgi:hypothetical protein
VLLRGGIHIQGEQSLMFVDKPATKWAHPFGRCREKIKGGVS